MADENLSGADIRRRFQKTDDGSSQPPAAGSGADIRKQFRDADATATKDQPPAAPQEPPLSAYGDATGGDQNLPSWMMQSPPSLEEIRDKIRQGDINALTYLKPGPDDNALTSAGKKAAMVGVHLGSKIVQFPIDALIGLTSGGGWSQSGSLTIDPNTNQVRLTPEAQAAGSVVANPLRFSGSTPLAAVPPGTLDRRAPLSPEFQANPMTAEASAAAATPPGGPTSSTGIAPPPTPQAAAGGATQPSAGPQPGMGGPQAGGAQVTPAAQSGMTPELQRAYGSTADKQWLYSSQQPGIRDTTEYYPGDTPTMAEREQTTATAREQKTQRNISTAADQAEREFLHERSEQRKGIFQEVAGSDATQHAAITEADTNISNGLAAAFRAGGKVNPEVITTAIEAEARTSGGKLPPVKAAMKDIREALQKADGSGMETDPQAVYQVRRVINYLQSKEGKHANPGYGSADVQAALARVKEAIDTAIEPAAPGFRKAIADYSNAQRAIEAREFLQAEEPKLYNSRGNMDFIKFHNFMQRVITMRDPRMPPNAAQSLTEAQMATLKGLHDSLKRSASADDLAKARGSDTAQNLMDIARQAISGVGGDVAAGLIGGLSHGPAGMVIGPMVKRGVGEFLTSRGQAKAGRRMNELLRPDPTQYPTTPNPMNQP